MRKTALTLTLLFVCLPLRAGWWAENDYSFGSNGFAKESLSVFSNITNKTVLSAGGSFYKDRGVYRDEVYSLRLPVMYSGNRYFISLKPFFYPTGTRRSRARGAKFYIMTTLGESEDLSYLHLTLSGAAAEQKTGLNLGGTRIERTFSQNAFEVQLEKGLYDQFFFLASAAGFTKPAAAKNSNLVDPVLDHSELAYLGTFRNVNALPEWAMALQLARNMGPEFNSHLYAGFSRISLRQAGMANSAVAGLKLRLNESSSVDLAYNFYKRAGLDGKSYYKTFIQIFF